VATGSWRGLVRRWWVAALLLIVLVTVGALAWNASPASPHTYTATRTMSVTVLPGDGDSAYGASVAQASEATSARKLAAPSMLSWPPFTVAVIGRLDGSRAFGVNGSLPTGAEVGQALRASHAGGDVTLSASWDTPGGASALADAAVQTLATVGAQSALPDGSSTSTTVTGLGDPARLDAAAQAARLADILVRGGLAALAVLIVAGALAAVQMSGRQGTSGRGHEPGGSPLDTAG
jgi:hypothetical protein